MTEQAGTTDNSTEINYIQEAREFLVEHVGTLPEANNKPFQDLLLMLMLSTGETTTLDDVHDAWAITQDKTDSSHPSIIPFDELQVAVGEKDKPYMEAVRLAATAYYRQEDEQDARQDTTDKGNVSDGN